ncbi:MAG: hypothetical protein HY696_11355 [Deltaproteobacteria bacterium]|nr:hypothetical protein [Deltaproteobacteria bacterium]
MAITALCRWLKGSTRKVGAPATARVSRPVAQHFGTLERFAQRPTPYQFGRDREALQLVELAWGVVSEHDMLMNARRTAGKNIELIRDCERRWCRAIRSFAEYAVPRFPDTMARVAVLSSFQQQGFQAALPFGVFAIAARRGDVDFVVSAYPLAAGAREVLAIRAGGTALEILDEADLEPEADWLNDLLGATTLVVAARDAA